MHNFFKFQNDVASDGIESHVFNMPKLLGSINRKEFHSVDYSGNAQLYTIGMKLYGTDAEGIVMTAPNMYATQRAVKEWHNARVKMFRRAGIKMKELGYGRSLRPYLDVNHENGTTVEIDVENGAGLGITPHFRGDDWQYSRAVVASPVEEGSTSGPGARDLVDSYSFTLCDASVTEDVTAEDSDATSDGFDQDSFVSVGMIAEWLDSFKQKAAGTDGNLLDINSIDADNALLQLNSAPGPQTEEVLELAEDSSKFGRPWDGEGAPYSALQLAGYSHTVLAGSDYVVFRAPCGLFQMSLQNNHTSSDRLGVTFEVLAIEDM